ncbi:MAG: ABC transporter substrate-binding protein [Deltaproteobacteria bacterium]|nr:ABC transporter substrate-binding protein [Deltaproteobacteria bacterium]
MQEAGSKTIVAGLLLALLALGLVLVPVAAAEDTIKIGGIFAVTGRASFLGDPEKKSMELFAEMVNAAGGIDGMKVETVIYDTEADPTKAVSFANRLINQDKVVAIVGPSTTPTSMAVIPIVEKAKIPFISCAAGNKITNPVKPYVFKTAQSDVLAVKSIYVYMEKHGIKKVGILCVDNGFGQSGREQLKEQASAHGITVVADETFGAKDTDMVSQLTKIRGAKPDAIICWGTNPGPAIVAKNAQVMKIGIPLYMSHGVASPKFIELAGDAAEGIILPAGPIAVADLLPEGNPQKPVLLDYIKRFNEKYGSGVSGFGGYAWDGMKILDRAIPGTGQDKKKIRDNIENIKGLVGVSGTFNFSPEEHNGLGDDSFVMVRIQNGTWALVD